MGFDNNLNITCTITHIVPPPQLNIEVNKSKTWNALTYPIPNIHPSNTIPPLPNYENKIPLSSLLNIVFTQMDPLTL